MRTHNVGLTAMARFVAVERYCQSHEPFSTHTTPGSGPDRTGGHADKSDSRSGSRAPARPQHG